MLFNFLTGVACNMHFELLALGDDEPSDLAVIENACLLGLL